MSSYYEKMPATGEVKCIDEEIPFELPNGWEWTRIRNVSQSYIGLTYSPTDVSSCGTIVLRSSNIQNGKIVLNDVVRVIKEISEKLQVEKNDIIICARNGSAKLVGKSAIVNSVSEPMTFGAFMAICKTSLYQYISIFLQSDLFFSQLRGVSSTTTINQLTQNNFNSFLVPVPPIKEQERIFEKMNEVIPVIEGYEVKQELLDKLNRNLNESIRKSVLQEAIQGKLVPQITEEGTAQELLEQIKAEKQRLVKEGKLKKSALNDSVIFKGGDNKYYEQVGIETCQIELDIDFPDSWLITRLSSLCALTDGEKREGQQLCLDAKFLRGKSCGDYLAKGKFVEKNDHIILVDGENSGEVFTVPCGGYMGSTFKQLWVSDAVSLEYVLHFIAFHKDLLRNSKKGAAIPHLNKEIFYSLIIGVPPVDEQKRIVEKINSLLKRL